MKLANFFYMFSILLMLFGSNGNLNAQERPKIGLVLSGGGARGGAHAGVIRYLQERHIPIDAIAGTSMGAFVGGLYASGISIDEIEKMLTTTEWKNYIVYNDNRDKISYRNKSLERGFPSSVKVGVNKDNEIAIGSGLFKRHAMLNFIQKKLTHIPNNIDFDKLRIPFRAVATDLSNGQTVALSSGSLAESIYASICIPGGFEPIVINGRTLVDGGVADNLPIDVMREMNVDIIIAVDISTPFRANSSFDGYLDVMVQLSDILMRKNVEQSIASMKENEILITPKLEGYTPLDADKYDEIIPRGYKAAQAAQSQLVNLSLDEQNYALYRKSIYQDDTYQKPVITKIELDNQTYMSDKRILSMLHVKTAQELDIKQLHKDIENIYSLMIFDDVTYKVVNQDKDQILKIKATPKWDINGQIKFSFGFEDDFNGHSDYMARVEYIKKGMNQYGGEWRSQVAIGREKLILSEFYQPIDESGNFYIRPELFYRDNKVYVNPSILGSHRVESKVTDSITISAKEYGGTLSTGVLLGNTTELEVGYTYKKVNPSMDYFLESTTGTTYVNSSLMQTVSQGYATVEVDTLDNQFFPKSGALVKAEYIHQLPELGSENQYEQASIELTGATHYDRHILLSNLKYGTTFNSRNFSNTEDFNAFFTLGGLFKLSGLPSNALSGDQMAFGSLHYRYALQKKDFFDELSVPMYLGTSLEVGQAWYREYGNDFLKDKWMHAGSIYLGADTILGPFFIGIGDCEGEFYNVYLMLGNSF